MNGGYLGEKALAIAVVCRIPTPRLEFKRPGRRAEEIELAQFTAF
jgi:hypothetical protein